MPEHHHAQRRRDTEASRYHHILIATHTHKTINHEPNLQEETESNLREIPSLAHTSPRRRISKLPCSFHGVEELPFPQSDTNFEW